MSFVFPAERKLYSNPLVLVLDFLHSKKICLYYPAGAVGAVSQTTCMAHSNHGGFSQPSRTFPYITTTVKCPFGMIPSGITMTFVLKVLFRKI